MNYKDLRKCLAIASVIISFSAVGVPDPVISKFMIALAAGFNAASLYLLKEEPSPPPESEPVG